MERIIELVLSLLLALGVTAPPGLGGSTPVGPPAEPAPPVHASGLVGGVAARVMAATDHVEGILGWVGCVAEAAATAPVPRDEDFDPRLGCGSLPVPPDDVDGDEQAEGAPFDVPPLDVPPLDVPPLDVPPLDVPPIVPPVVPVDIPPVEIPQLDIPPVTPPVGAVP